MLIILGLAAVGLAGSQFSRVGLDNYRDIDLRILNYFHALVGLVGLYCVHRSHGSIVAKTLYVVSIIFAIATAIFYGFTTYRVRIFLGIFIIKNFKIVDLYRQLLRLENVEGFDQEYGEDSANYVGRIVISSVMITVAAATALTSMVAVIVLDKLVIVDAPTWPPQSVTTSNFNSIFARFLIFSERTRDRAKIRNDTTDFRRCHQTSARLGHRWVGCLS